VDQDRPYKSFKKYVDRSKEQPKPIEQNFPLRSNHAEVSSSIWTNHYEITLDPKYRLYDYRIDGLAGRNKNKTKKLIKVAIEHLPFLKTNKDKFATEYFSTIIAWKSYIPTFRKMISSFRLRVQASQELFGDPTKFHSAENPQLQSGSSSSVSLTRTA
jgi:hypothetical protein